MQGLPVELRARIFVACLPDDLYVQPRSGQPPLVLAHVCRHWRAVALRLPQLWCSLDAKEGHGTGVPHAVRCERMNLYRAWLSRAGNLPLSLGVSFSENSLLREKWLQDVRSSIGRFKRLRIAIAVGLDFAPLLDGAHMLKHLTIDARSHDADLPAMKLKPSLHTLVLDLPSASQPLLLHADWANLTRLAVRASGQGSYNPDSFLHLLDHCPNLEKVIFGPTSASSIPQPPRSYPNLQELTFIPDGAAEEEYFLMLILPRLLVLRVLEMLGDDLEGVLFWDQRLAPFPLGGAGDSQEQESPCAKGLPKCVCRIRDECWEEFNMFDLCFANVTHLDLEVGNGTAILAGVLVLCPNLLALSLYGRRCNAFATSLQTNLTHPTLSLLSMTVWAEFGNFFFAATLPALRELRILTASYGEPEHLRAFLVRSGCPLEVLRVKANSSRAWTKEEQVELKGLIPALRDLELTS